MYNCLILLQLGAGGHRRPLTMGNQTSETHDEFRAQPGITTQGDFAPNPQGFLLHNHHTDGPSKVNFISNPILQHFSICLYSVLYK